MTEEKENKKKPKKGLWDRMFKKGNLQKKKVAILFLRNNGRAETYELEAKNGFFNINNQTYHEDRDCIYSMGKERYPLAVIQEWSVVPIGRKVFEDKNIQEKFHIFEDHVMKGIRHAERVRSGEKEGMQLTGKTIVVIIIAVVIGIALLSQFI